MAKTDELLIDVVVDESCSWDLIPLDLDQLPQNGKVVQSPPKNPSHAENELPLVGKQTKVEERVRIPQTKPFDKKINKATRLLSKERFEEWLDALIPGSPSSQVSTLPHSEDPPAPPDANDDADQKPCQLDVITPIGNRTMASTVEYAACGACGMVSRDGGVRTGELVIRDGREKGIRDWGVQTDITGCFVVL